jgi:hypothetical protein
MTRPAILSIIAFLTLMPLGAQAGQEADSAQCHSSEAGRVSKKAIRISGTVGSNGKTFTSDSDSKIWMISNPEAFSGIKEFHVRIKAQIDPSQVQIQVMSVTAIGEEQVGIKFGDAAFRR